MNTKKQWLDPRIYVKTSSCIVLESAPFMWVLKGSLLLIYSLAAQLEWHSLSSRSEACLKSWSKPLETSEISWIREWTHRTLYRSSCAKHLFHRLAVALWRGNASLWLHRQSPLAPALDNQSAIAMSKNPQFHGRAKHNIKAFVKKLAMEQSY